MFKTFFDNFRRLEAPQLHPAMVLRFRLLDLLCALLLLCTVLALLATPARAQSASTIFLTDRNGQIAFPFTPPNRATGGPANINNTAIGQTTPKNGKFLVLEATTSFKSPDGVTCATYAPSGTPAAVDAVFFIATRAYNIVSISAVFSVTAGGASKLQVTKDTATDAPGAGTDILTNNTNTGFDLAATANTVQTGTFAATSLAAGNRLAVDYANTIQSTAGVVVTVCLAPQ